MDALAVAVHLGGEIGPVLPALELGAIVEGDGDELRRTLDGAERPASTGNTDATQRNAYKRQQHSHTPGKEHDRSGDQRQSRMCG